MSSADERRAIARLNRVVARRRYTITRGLDAAPALAPIPAARGTARRQVRQAPPGS